MDPDEDARAQTLRAHFGRSYKLSTATLLACLAATISGTIAISMYGIPKVNQAVRAQRDVTQVTNAMLEQQGDFRAYLSTHDDRFLQQYRLGAAAISKPNESLIRRGGSTKSFVTLFVNWRVAQQAWSQSVEDVLAKPSWSVDATIVLRDTAARFDSYRSAERQLNAALEHGRVGAIREIYLVSGVLTGVVLILLIVGLVLTRRERHILEELVLAPMTQLETVARRVAGGDLDVEVEPTGVEDFRQLGKDINSMTKTLAAERERARSEIELVGHESTQLRDLLEFVRTAGSYTGLAELQRFLCDESRLMTDADGVVLMERFGDGDLKVVCTSGDVDLVNCDDKVVERAAMVGRTIKTESSIVVPLVHAGQIIALLRFNGDTKAMDDELVELIGVQCGGALVLVRAHEEAEYLSEHDPLTDAMNRRRFDVDLELELNRAARYGSPVSLMMIDLDAFKTVNDTYGHYVGDRVLRVVASALQAVMRATDSAYRFGGEEFAVIARQADLSNTFSVAARVKKAVEQEVAAILPVSLSIGIAAAPEVGHSASELIGRADAALYKAKEMGRNQIVAARLSDFVEVS